jgi:phenylalanine-4-hydroxylase
MATSAVNPPPNAGRDWTVPQEWDAYTANEHAMWDQLFARQAMMLEGRASEVFLRGLDVLHLSRPGIPDFRELSERLEKLTGWTVVAVPGLVPDAVFFEHLANRRFVAGRFLRKPAQIDYIQEPDVFHDVFGHVPLLSNPFFADYMQAYGVGGLRALQFNALEKLARLYWYTVEFGLIRERSRIRLYGSGIVSSFAEAVFALDDPSPHHIQFDLERVMRTRYRIDDYQRSYFVIDSFEDLRHQTADVDFAPLYRQLQTLTDISPEAVLSSDQIIRRGTQTRTMA